MYTYCNGFVNYPFKLSFNPHTSLYTINNLLSESWYTKIYKKDVG